MGSSPLPCFWPCLFIYIVSYLYPECAFMQDSDEGTSNDEDEEGPANELPELPSGKFYVERIVAKKAKVAIRL